MTLRSALLATLLGLAALAQAEVVPVDNDELSRLLGEGVPLIDVRTANEWRSTGVIEGSHLVTFFDAQGNYDLQAWLTRLREIAPDGQPVALICHSGNRSGRISRFLSSEYPALTVYDAGAGMRGWAGQGRPTVAPP